MSEMVERVARAIWSIRREEEDRCDMELEDMGRNHAVWTEARAAIEAMREPTPAMLEAGTEAFERDEYHMSIYHCIGVGFVAMIDAALSEEAK